MERNSTLWVGGKEKNYLLKKENRSDQKPFFNYDVVDSALLLLISKKIMFVMLIAPDSFDVFTLGNFIWTL